MSGRKIIVITEEMDKALGNICDAALKNAGMHMVPSINALLDAVEEDSEQSDT